MADHQHERGNAGKSICILHLELSVVLFQVLRQRKCKQASAIRKFGQKVECPGAGSHEIANNLSIGQDVV